MRSQIMNTSGVRLRLRLPMAFATVIMAGFFTAANAEDAPATPSAAAPAATEAAPPPPAAEAPKAADASSPPTYKTTNSPAEILPKASASMLLDVTSVDGGYVAVGERGHILRSKDGVQWKQVPVPTRATLTAVTFVDASNGWAVGHDAVILHTTDGGGKWEVQHFDPRLEKPFLDVLFLDAQHGFAVGAYGLLMETKDAGTTWNQVTTEVRTDEWHFNAITKLGDGALLIVGEGGGLALSTDSGATWKKLPAPYEGSFFGALPKGQKGAVVFGLRGNVLVTDDVVGGKWTKVDSQTEQGLLGGASLSNGEVLIVGNAGVALRSESGVTSLKRIPDPVGTGLSSAVPMDGKVIVVGESGVHTLSAQ